MWPRNSPKFTTKQKNLWKDSLRAVFGNSYSGAESLQLHVKFYLGHWINNKVQDDWECFYSASENRLYIKEEDHWGEYQSNNNRPSTRYKKSEFLYDGLPVTRVRLASYSHTPSKDAVTLESHRAWDYHEAFTDTLYNYPYSSFVTIEHAFEESIDHPEILIDEVKIPKDKCESIAEAIKKGTVCLIIDGLYFPENEAGSSAFILTAGKTKKNKLIGMNWVPGTREEQDPYRSKLAGINGELSMIAIILIVFDIKQGQIEIALDGLSALKD